MPPGVGVVDHLRDVAAVRDHVVRGDVRRRVAEPRDRAGVAALHGVDHHVADRVAGAALRVVAGVRRRPDDAGVAVGAVELQRLAEGALAVEAHRHRVQHDLVAVRELAGDAVLDRVEDAVGVVLGEAQVLPAGAAGDHVVPVGELLLAEGRVPGEDAVGEVPQHRRAAADVGGDVGGELLARQAGELHRQRERAVEVAEVQRAVAAVDGGLARVHEEARLDPGDALEQLHRHAVLVRRGGERPLEGAGRDAALVGGGAAGGEGEEGEGEGAAHGGPPGSAEVALQDSCRGRARRRRAESRAFGARRLSGSRTA